ncbi:MAG: hypothetical protein QME58_00120 [Bacteroidota bacterium]|nr:hypothetical protein [Bacteroidota bacterium]
MDTNQILSNLSFGKVDAESDDKLANCFIGTDLFKQTLQPRHTLLLGGKGSGKSAFFRLLSQDIYRLTPLLHNSFTEIYSIPAYGLHSDEYISYSEIQEINPQTIDDFKYFWQLYFGLKTAGHIATCPRMRSRVNSSKSDSLKSNYNTIISLLSEIGLYRHDDYIGRMNRKIKDLLFLHQTNFSTTTAEKGRILTKTYKGKTALNIVSLLDLVDKVLKETKCLAWILADQIDLLYLDNLERREKAITALIQLLIVYSNRFSNINLKVFLRTDIFKELQIVNKSHLVSLTVELKWADNLLIKLLVARAVHDRVVRAYCEKILNENLDVVKVISANDELMEKVFHLIFNLNINGHKWIMKRMIDGLGMLYPREFIHLGNQAVIKQREINKLLSTHTNDGVSEQISQNILSVKAIKEAFSEVSKYRCDTFLYAEFPHLKNHFNQFKGLTKILISREELYTMFNGLTPSGANAVRAIYETGLLQPIGNKNVDACLKFTIPPLYKSGLGIVSRRKKSVSIS